MMPVSRYEGLTPIANWINEANIEVARLQLPNPAFRDASIERFNAGIAQDADTRVVGGTCAEWKWAQR